MTTEFQLPFSDKKQTALLGHMIVNEKFFAQTVIVVEPGWFSDTFISKIWKIARDFHEKWHRKPTKDEIQHHESMRLEDQAVRNRMISKLDSAYLLTSEFGLDVLSAELTAWMKAELYKKYVEESTRLYNDKKIDLAFSKLQEGAKRVELASFQSDIAVDFGDYETFLSDQEKELQHACSFGNQQMDRLLVPNTPGGGLLRKDMTTLLAPTNVGKTTCMVTILSHNILHGKSVLFLTHEGRPEDLKSKILRSCMNATLPELQALTKDERGRKLLSDRYNRFIKPNLTYVPMNKPGLTVEEVVATIARLQDRRMAENDGKGYDLIIDDYPQKLTTEQASKGQFALRHILSYVYNQFTQVALQHNLHVVCAVQANREASRINQKQKGSDDRLITMEDVSESFDVMQTSTNVISINRSAEDERNDTVVYYIAKSRSGEKGFAVVCTSRYGASIAHGNPNGGFKSTSYRGTGTMGGKVMDLLAQYDQKALPYGFSGE